MPPTENEQGLQPTQAWDVSSKKAFVSALFRFCHIPLFRSPQVPQADVYEFLRSLRTVLLPGTPVPGDGKEMGEVLLGFREFEALLNNPQSGLGVYGLVLRLEKPDKRHNAFCAVDEKRIVGMRFKEVNLNFSLCGQSYCEGKVPKEFQDQSSFTFKVLE